MMNVGMHTLCYTQIQSLAKAEFSNNPTHLGVFFLQTYSDLKKFNKQVSLI